MAVRNINDRLGDRVEFASVEEMAAAVADLGYSTEDGRLVEGRDYEDLSVVCGCAIQIDRSGVGHCWVAADEIPESIREEIAAEIIDGGNESCDDYIASNGQHYRW
jgi:ferredoxin-thioredoxin reductase catalytic subunit